MVKYKILISKCFALKDNWLPKVKINPSVITKKQWQQQQRDTSNETMEKNKIIHKLFH